jgi:hypothetical protein
LFVLAQHRSLRLLLSLPGLIVRLLEPSCQISCLGSVGLASRVDLRAEVGGSGAGLGEVAGEDGLKERAEDNLGATAKMLERAYDAKDQMNLRSLGESHPEDENKLEGVVEGCSISNESNRVWEWGTHGTSRRR